MLPPSSGWPKSTPVSITATVTALEPVVTFQASSASMSASAVPLTPLDGLAGVPQAPELVEGRVVRDGGRVDAVVLLRVVDARLRRQDLQRALGGCRIRLRELRLLVAEALGGMGAGRGQGALLLGVGGSGLEADDQLARDRVLLRRLVRLAIRLRSGDGREQQDGQTDDDHPDSDPWRPHALSPLCAAAPLAACDGRPR